MPASEDSIRRDILGYLAHNPQAEDTVDGIASWWLLEEEFLRTKEMVKRVADELVTEGLLLARHTADGKTYYRARGIETDRTEEL